MREIKTRIIKQLLSNRSRILGTFGISVFVYSSQATSAVYLYDKNQWQFGVNGHIPVFALMSDHDADEDAFRITTGFNPATIQFNVKAPKQYGKQVSGHVQLNSHLSGADGKQNSGFGKEDFGRVSGVESRVAEIAVSGDFGTFNIGKGFGIFGTPAIGDNGSGLGVGLFSPNAGDATAGRINNGYFYANFNPRIIYTSNDMGGVQFKVGLFQPEKPKDDTAIDASVETKTPRIEANIVWSNDNLQLWSSMMYQQVDVASAGAEDFTMTGIDLGGAYSLDAFKLRANYSTTQGTGNGVVGGHGVTGGAQEEDASQWYLEGTYDLGHSTYGLSYGEGSDDLSGSDTDLTMLFYRYRCTDSLTLMAEYQSYGVDAANADYQAFIVGTQFTF